MGINYVNFLRFWLVLICVNVKMLAIAFFFFGIKKKDVKRERQHNDLIQGVNNFSAEKLKRTDTLEKVILPNAQGETAHAIFYFLLCIMFEKHVFRQSYL